MCVSGLAAFLTIKVNVAVHRLGMQMKALPGVCCMTTALFAFWGNRIVDAVHHWMLCMLCLRNLTMPTMLEMLALRISA